MSFQIRRGPNLWMVAREEFSEKSIICSGNFNRKHLHVETSYPYTFETLSLIRVFYVVKKSC